MGMLGHGNTREHVTKPSVGITTGGGGGGGANGVVVGWNTVGWGMWESTWGISQQVKGNLPPTSRRRVLLGRCMVNVWYVTLFHNNSWAHPTNTSGHAVQ